MSNLPQVESVAGGLDPQRGLTQLLDDVVAVLDHCLEREPEARGFRGGRDSLAASDWNGDPGKEPQPVVERWIAAESRSRAALSAADRLRELALGLVWEGKVPSYAGKAIADAFAFTLFAGPRSTEWPPAPFACDGIRVGFSLQGPDLYYQPHSHKAVELYCILEGTARWQLDRGEWIDKGPGDVIFHPSEILHAMWTGPGPLLCLFAWTGDMTRNIYVDRDATP